MWSGARFLDIALGASGATAALIVESSSGERQIALDTGADAFLASR